MPVEGLKGPYNLRLVESCLGCVAREEGLFCHLPHGSLSALNSLRQTSIYPKGVLLFVDGQPTRGLYVLCSGQAKLYANSPEGQNLTLRIVEPGEVLGLSSLFGDERYPAPFGSRDKRLAFFDKDQIPWKQDPRARLYANLLRLKHRHPALMSGMEPGNLVLIDTGNPKVFAFRRVKGRDRVTVTVNLSPTPADVVLKQAGHRRVRLGGWGWSID